MNIEMVGVGIPQAYKAGDYFDLSGMNLPKLWSLKPGAWMEYEITHISPVEMLLGCKYKTEPNYHAWMQPKRPLYHILERWLFRHADKLLVRAYKGVRKLRIHLMLKAEGF